MAPGAKKVSEEPHIENKTCNVTGSKKSTALGFALWERLKLHNVCRIGSPQKDELDHPLDSISRKRSSLQSCATW